MGGKKPNQNQTQNKVARNISINIVLFLHTPLSVIQRLQHIILVSLQLITLSDPTDLSLVRLRL